MADGIQPNPLLALLPEAREVSGQRPAEEQAARTWTAVQTLVGFVRALVGLLEFHVETVTAAGTRIPHRLRRRPFGRIILWQGDNVVVFDDYEKWTTEHIRMYTAARSCRVAFALFCLLLCAGTLGAAECATYGYAQAQPVRFWLCESASETTTGATEGDYRYNKDTNGVQTYDGAAWNAVGGGSGAPTTATYITQTADAGLSAEQALGALASGILKSTTGTGVVSIATSGSDYAPATSGSTVLLGNGLGGFSGYSGTSCTNQFPRSLSSGAAATCASVNLASGGDTTGDLPFAGLVQASAASKLVGRGSASGAGDFEEITLGTNLSLFGTTLNASGGGTPPTGTGYYHTTAGVMDAAADLVTLTSAADVAANQGTTTTVLHGNAAGQASFASVDLTNDTASVLPLAKLTDDGTSGLCLLSGGGAGDPAYTTCPGGGGGLSYAQVSAAAVAGF